MKSEYKINLTEAEMDEVKEAIELLEGIDDRNDYGSSQSDADFEVYQEIARWLGNRIIKRIKETPF